MLAALPLPFSQTALAIGLACKTQVIGHRQLFSCLGCFFHFTVNAAKIVIYIKKHCMQVKCKEKFKCMVTHLAIV